MSGLVQPRQRLDGRQAVLVLLLVIALAAVGVVYRSTLLSIGHKWFSDDAFSHGLLILPISLWLAWRKRAALAQTAFAPSSLGVIAAALCTLAWIVARGSGVLVVEQFAAVALVPALVLAALGPRATRVLIVPLAFLFFMVPFGRALVPMLMQVTADFATVLLQWSGVPVLRSHMYISIPDGNFEVARACSGLNYFITSLVLGCLYAYLNFNGWLKRSICVVAFVVLPVVLNGLRVYVTILVSHLTQMRFGPGEEHVMFGRVFFVVVMLALFWLARRWNDDAEPAKAVAPSGEYPPTRPVWTWWPLALACAVALAGPPFLSASKASAAARLAAAGELIRLPAGAANWQGPADAAGRWRPQYRGGLQEAQGVYRAPDGSEVDVFVAVYGLGNTLGAEMISYGNVIAEFEHQSLANDSRHPVEFAGGKSHMVRQLVVNDGGRERLVWHWYVVGEQPVVSQFAAKALEATAFLTRGACRRAHRDDLDAHGRHGRATARGVSRQPWRVRRAVASRSRPAAHDPCRPAAGRAHHPSARLRRAGERARQSRQPPAGRTLPARDRLPVRIQRGVPPAHPSHGCRGDFARQAAGQGLRRLRPHVEPAAQAAARRSSTRAISAPWTCSGSLCAAGVRHRVHGEHGWEASDPKGLNPKRPAHPARLPTGDPSLRADVAGHRTMAGRRRWASIPARIRQLYSGVDTESSDPHPNPLPLSWERVHSPALAGEGRGEGSDSPSAPSVASTPSRTSRASWRRSAPAPVAIPRLGLTIVGDGPLRASLEAQAASLGISNHVTFTGARSDTPDLMRSFDVFVLPSINEGISNTILEAMATGLPVVAGRVGGNPELIADGVTGRLYDLADPQGLEHALLPYLTDPALRQAHGKAGRNRVVQNFSLDAMVDRYLNLYDELLADR